MLVVPLKMLMRVAAVTLFMLKTDVRYTMRLDEVPIVPSFSKVSFPATNLENTDSRRWVVQSEAARSHSLTNDEGHGFNSSIVDDFRRLIR